MFKTKVTDGCIELFSENEYTGKPAFREADHKLYLINHIDPFLLKIVTPVWF
jgi:hypothetical protein